MINQANQNVDIEHLSAMLNCITEGVFTIDNEKHITFFNKAAERITGFSAHEAVGQPCRDIFRADICGENCTLDKLKHSETSITGRHVDIVDRNSRSLTVSLNAALIQDNIGNYTGCIETFRDISTEEELRRRVEKNYTFHDIVSRHPEMHKIFAVLPDIAQSNVPVLIEGDSGTGKELLKQSIAMPEFSQPATGLSLNWLNKVLSGRPLLSFKRNASQAPFPERTAL